MTLFHVLFTILWRFIANRHRPQTKRTLAFRIEVFVLTTLIFHSTLAKSNQMSMCVYDKSSRLFHRLSSAEQNCRSTNSNNLQFSFSLRQVFSHIWLLKIEDCLLSMWHSEHSDQYSIWHRKKSLHCVRLSMAQGFEFTRNCYLRYELN